MGTGGGICGCLGRRRPPPSESASSVDIFKNDEDAAPEVEMESPPRYQPPAEAVPPIPPPVEEPVPVVNTIVSSTGNPVSYPSEEQNLRAAGDANRPPKPPQTVEEISPLRLNSPGGHPASQDVPISTLPGSLDHTEHVESRASSKQEGSIP